MRRKLKTSCSRSRISVALAASGGLSALRRRLFSRQRPLMARIKRGRRALGHLWRRVWGKRQRRRRAAASKKWRGRRKRRCRRPEAGLGGGCRRLGARVGGAASASAAAAWRVAAAVGGIGGWANVGEDISAAWRRRLASGEGSISAAAAQIIIAELKAAGGSPWRGGKSRHGGGHRTLRAEGDGSRAGGRAALGRTIVRGPRRSAAALWTRLARQLGAENSGAWLGAGGILGYRGGSALAALGVSHRMPLCGSVWDVQVALASQRCRANLVMNSGPPETLTGLLAICLSRRRALSALKEEKISMAASTARTMSGGGDSVNRRHGGAVGVRALTAAPAAGSVSIF